MPDTKQQSTAAPEQATDPNWVKEMHDYFRQYGFYRAQDLQRVLGDPRDHLEVQAASDSPINFITRTK